MGIKGDDYGNEGQSSPQVWDWNQISEEAARAANDYLGSGAPSPEPEQWKGHRRSQSEAGGSGRHRRRNSFQSFKYQLSRALRWGWNSHSDNDWNSFDPEVLADQKRQWYQLHTPDRTKYQEPTALFEHFIVTGLHPDANLEAVEAAFARRKKWLSETPRSNGVDGRSLYYRGPSQPSLDAQMIFKYPPAKKLPMRQKDFCAFTFPGGVKARLLERTPSMSDLNSLVYGQEHLRRDDLAFVFSLKAADNGTLYGVCLHVPEIVQRPPAILGCSLPLSHPSGGCCRFLVSAPRCYCLLTRVPFFKLHYEMLNSIIAQERLNRITQFVNEMSPIAYSLSAPRVHDDLLDEDSEDEDWMSMAIPVESAIALSAAAAGIMSEDEPPSASRSTESLSPKSVDGLEFGHVPDGGESETPVTEFGRADEISENGTASPEAPMPENNLERSSSTLSMYSSVRSIDDDDGYFSSQENEYSNESLTMEWAKETKNDMLQVVCAYGAMSIPERGSDTVFHPLKHMQAIHYKRPSVSELRIDESSLDTDNNPLKFAEMSSRLAAAEEAFALSVWTTATLCRVLSLDSILALLTGVLLEKQVVVFCPNLGVLSAVTLSLTPMLRPFEWQSLFLPILPVKMLDFLDAPVPYIVGMQNIPGDMRFKTSNLVQVDVAKDQVKTCSLPLLPRRKQLYNELRPIHATLAGQYRIATKHPVYRCNEVQVKEATRFVNAINSYLESLCADLRVYSITNVQSNDDRVSLLLKDTFIDSFSSKDRPFIKLFVDTQMFSVLSDSRLATFEHEAAVSSSAHRIPQLGSN